jgi:hypothetical protein
MFFCSNGAVLMPFDEPNGFFVFDYAWIFLILVTIVNALILKARSASSVREHPELREGYDQLFKGYLLYMNIPWVVMGVGMLLGRVPSTISFFTPRHGNIFVIAFHLSVVFLWLLSIWWIYFKGGAEFLVRYKGVFNRDIQSPTVIKLFAGLMLLGGIVGMTFMWSL